MIDLDMCMWLAIEEARASLRDGNNGFGAVIVRDGEVISAAHDLENSSGDPTSHAEMNAIREASKKLGKNLERCVLVSTHEPCPMCAAAIARSGMREIAYGYSISEAKAQGRKRTDIPCREIFRRADAEVEIHPAVLHEECALLYRRDVRAEIIKLRGISDEKLKALNMDSWVRRAGWFKENREKFEFLSEDKVYSGYRVLLARLNITEEEAPVVQRSAAEIVFRSRNFCPTLEACKILGLDTRVICKQLNEGSTDRLVKQVDGRLRFSRNYELLRPYSDYCEERISLDE